jgi:hypothetical protein
LNREIISEYLVKLVKEKEKKIQNFWALNSLLSHVKYILIS